MKNIKKGDYGYRKLYKIQSLIIIIVFIAAILLQVFLSKIYSGRSISKILIVMAILTVLPMANLASPFLASIKYNTPKVNEYKKIAVFEDSLYLIYDLILTMREQIMPMDYIALSDNEINLYMSSKKASKELAAEFIYKNLKVYDKNKIFIYDDIDGFIAKLAKMNSYGGSKNSCENIKNILLSISI